MAVARFGFGKPEANVDELLYTVVRSSLISVVAVNLSGATKITAWLVPDGEDLNTDSWIYFANQIELTNRNTFETFKTAANVGDKLYVNSEHGEVTFFVNGVYDTTGNTDVTVGEYPAESPQVGSLWVHNTIDPPEVKYWDGSIWQITGIIGPTGPANNLTIGTVVGVGPNDEPSATITGPTPNQVLSFALKQGPTGPQGVFNVFESAPTGPSEGQVWFNSNDGRFYVYYDGYWVEALSNEAGPTGPTGPAGAGGGGDLSGYAPLDSPNFIGTSSITSSTTGPSNYVNLKHNADIIGRVSKFDLGEFYETNRYALEIKSQGTSNDYYSRALFRGDGITTLASLSPTGANFLSASSNGAGITSSVFFPTLSTSGGVSTAPDNAQMRVQETETIGEDVVQKGSEVSLGKDTVNILVDTFGNSDYQSGLKIAGDTFLISGYEPADLVTKIKVLPTGVQVLKGAGTPELMLNLDNDGNLFVKGSQLLSFSDKVLTSNTLTLSDSGKFIKVNNSSANTLQIPLDSTALFPLGCQITVMQTGTGQTTITAAVGVSLNATPGLKLRTRWSSATLIKLADNQWVAIGDLVA